MDKRFIRSCRRANSPSPTRSSRRSKPSFEWMAAGLSDGCGLPFFPAPVSDIRLPRPLFKLKSIALNTHSASGRGRTTSDAATSWGASDCRTGARRVSLSWVRGFFVCIVAVQSKCLLSWNESTSLAQSPKWAVRSCMGRRVMGAWWPSRSSKPLSARFTGRGKFDSYPLRHLVDFKSQISNLRFLERRCRSCPAGQSLN